MKRLLSILLFCAMVLTMLPAPAFAEDVCTCTDPCTAENMNSACLSAAPRVPPRKTAHRLPNGPMKHRIRTP